MIPIPEVLMNILSPLSLFHYFGITGDNPDIGFSAPLL